MTSVPSFRLDVQKLLPCVFKSRLQAPVQTTYYMRICRAHAPVFWHIASDECPEIRASRRSAWDKEWANICASHSAAVAQQRFLSALLRPAGRADLELETVSSSPEPLLDAARGCQIQGAKVRPRQSVRSLRGARHFCSSFPLLPLLVVIVGLLRSQPALLLFKLSVCLPSFIPLFHRSFVRPFADLSIIIHPSIH